MRHVGVNVLFGGLEGCGVLGGSAVILEGREGGRREVEGREGERREEEGREGERREGEGREGERREGKGRKGGKVEGGRGEGERRKGEGREIGRKTHLAKGYNPWFFMVWGQSSAYSKMGII